MGTELKRDSQNIDEQSHILKERQSKIEDMRKAIGPLSDMKLSRYCSDASIARYLRARNWNVKKATKMLKETLKWRLDFKPDEIRWEDIAREAESGKIYRSNIVDKNGRTVLVMRPCRQNSDSVIGQMKYLVYCMENAIFNLPPNQEQMIWLVDFLNFNMSNISVKSTKETAKILQNQYPERLGFAIMYNPPKFFEQFWMLVKPFLEPKTRKKVKFVYTDVPSTKKIMEELFDMDQLESAFGGNSSEDFNVEKYAEMMKEDDEKKQHLWEKGQGNDVTSCYDLLSDDDVPSEEDEEMAISSSSPSIKLLSQDVSSSVEGMSLEDPGNSKA